MKSVKSLDQLIKELSNVVDPQKTHWYRGHAKSEWTLVPGYFRKKNPLSEDLLMKKFKQNAALLIGNTPTTSFDWLLWMQHYGVPTRLLDWTESPLVALYFAVSETRHAKSDGMLWVMQPTLFNEVTQTESLYDNFIPSFDVDQTILQPYSPESFAAEKRSKNPPVAVIATRNNTRLQAQQGVFTISHRDQTPIEKLKNTEKKHTFSIKIPASSKAKILRELELCGISEFQLFPELTSIGKNISAKFFL